MQNRFKLILEEKNLTAKMAAEIIGINASAISHLLNGNRKPSFEVLEKIAQAFPELNMNWFIQGEGKAWSGAEPLDESEECLNDTTAVDAITFSNGILDVNAKKNRRTLQRVLLFFDDGSFEEYNC
ncbi:MAG: helix-turn-helix domain-containing protein [Marinifilaceae bacterium]